MLDDSLPCERGRIGAPSSYLPATAAALAAAELAFRAVRTRTSLRDLQLALHPVFAAQSADRRLHGISGVHGDKREATWAPGGAVCGHVDFSNFAVGGEKAANVIFSSSPWQVADVHFGVHSIGARTLCLRLGLFPSFPGFKSLTNTTFIRVTYHAFDWTAVLAGAPSSSSRRKIALVLTKIPAKSETAQGHHL